METTTKIAKVTLGRLLAEYQGIDDKDLLTKLKAIHAKKYGYDTIEAYQKDLDSLEANKSKPGKREFDASYQMGYCTLAQTFVNALRNTSATSDDYKKAVVESLDKLITYSDEYKDEYRNDSKRTDYRRMLILDTGNKAIKIHFGGWGDGSSQARNQYGSGRLTPDANSNMDGDKVTSDMDKLPETRKLINQVLKASSPYNNGQSVPVPKSSGFEQELVLENKPSDETFTITPEKQEEEVKKMVEATTPKKRQHRRQDKK